MRSFILGTTVMVANALLSPVQMAEAADLKVLSSVALTAVLNELTPEFENATGHRLNIGYGLAAELKKRVLDGEPADVIILTRPMMDELEKENKLSANSLTNASGSPVSVAARQSRTSVRLTRSRILSSWPDRSSMPIPRKVARPASILPVSLIASG